jgi:uncharacterized NAD(P)/FAD-binding protein YdhS
MSCLPPHADARTVAVIGGGLSGSLFALKLSAIKPDWIILLVEKNGRLGPGLAYGACGPQHVLNVPVSRMEVGLAPSFENWLRLRPTLLVEALEESAGQLADAFVPRRLFGEYMEQQVSGALDREGRGGIRRVHGEAMTISSNPRQVLLDDGRVLDVDGVVLACGHEAPALPVSATASANIISDPWVPGVLDAIAAQAPLLLVGSGLTMVDVLLSLQVQGHMGPIHVISRHGLLPQAHQSGGSWGPVLQPGLSPRKAMLMVRTHIRAAQNRGIPWQRVFDAARPAITAIWHGWNTRQRSQFLRHLRALWDVHRHRMAARVAKMVECLVADRRLFVAAGKILALDESRDGVVAMVRPRAGKVRLLEIKAVINCTGPRMNLRHAAQPLLTALQRQGLAQSDPLGLGLETEDCALRGSDGTVSDWLYALGPLTRPAWWEIVAVPEINAQVERLVRKITSIAEELTKPLPILFLDIGAGI